MDIYVEMMRIDVAVIEIVLDPNQRWLSLHRLRILGLFLLIVRVVELNLLHLDLDLDWMTLCEIEGMADDSDSEDGIWNESFSYYPFSPPQAPHYLRSHFKMNGEKGQVSASPPPRQSGRKRQKTSNQDEPALVHRSNTKSRSASNDQSRSASPFVKKQNQSIAFTNDTEIQQQAEEGDEDSDATADQVTTLIQTDDNHSSNNSNSTSNPNPRYGARSNKGSNPPTPTVKNHLLNQRVSQSPTRSNSPRDRSNQKGNTPKMSRAGHSFTLEIDERESPRKKSGGKGKGKEKEKEKGTEKESNGEDAVVRGNGNGMQEEQQLVDKEHRDGEEREKPETDQERKEREMEENLLQSWKEEFFESESFFHLGGALS